MRFKIDLLSGERSKYYTNFFCASGSLNSSSVYHEYKSVSVWLVLCLHELAGQFLTLLSTELGVSNENLLADRKVMNTIQIKFTRGINVTCFRHVLTLVRSSYV